MAGCVCVCVCVRGRARCTQVRGEEPEQDESTLRLFGCFTHTFICRVSVPTRRTVAKAIAEGELRHELADRQEVEIVC